MATAAPERTLDQRMTALERANDIRSRRAQLKRDVKAGRKSVYTILFAPPDYVSSMAVWDLLLAIPHWGTTKTAKRLVSCKISLRKTVGGLSERQRGELAELISAPDRAEGLWARMERGR